jgi:hypothetical protein
MDKLCKRCQFRTPSIRALCQVCGHKEFVAIDHATQKSDQPEIIQSSENESFPEAVIDFSAVRSRLSSLRLQLSSASTQLIAETRVLYSKIKSAAKKIYLLAIPPAKVNASECTSTEIPPVSSAPALSTPVARSTTARRLERSPEARHNAVIETYAEIAPGDTAARKARLNELLVWFQSYGNDSSILSSESSKKNDDANELRTKHAA